MRAALCLLAGLLAAVPARADPATLRQIAQGLANQPSRTTRFTEEKHISSLTQPVRSEGSMVFRKPDTLEQHTTAPQPETLVIAGREVSISRPGAATRRLSVDDSPALRILADTLRGALAGDLAALRRHFRVSEAGPLSAWRITLLPAGNVTAQVVRRATIDGSFAVVRQIDIVQVGGDEQRIMLIPQR